MKLLIRERWMRNLLIFFLENEKKKKILKKNKFKLKNGLSVKSDYLKLLKNLEKKNFEKKKIFENFKKNEIFPIEEKNEFIIDPIFFKDKILFEEKIFLDSFFLEYNNLFKTIFFYFFKIHNFENLGKFPYIEDIKKKNILKILKN